MIDTLNFNSIQSKLSTCLLKAIAFDGASKGILQIYYPEKEVLKVVASHRLSQEFLMNFHEVSAFTPSACGRALGINSTVAIQDVFEDRAFKPYIDLISQENIRAIRSMPIKCENGSLVGMLTVQFTEPQPDLNINTNISDSLIEEIRLQLQNIITNQELPY